MFYFFHKKINFSVVCLEFLFDFNFLINMKKLPGKNFYLFLIKNQKTRRSYIKKYSLFSFLIIPILLPFLLVFLPNVLHFFKNTKLFFYLRLSKMFLRSCWKETLAKFKEFSLIKLFSPQSCRFYACSSVCSAWNYL